MLIKYWKNISMDRFYKADKAFGDYIKKRDIIDGYFICPTCKRRVDAIYAKCGHLFLVNITLLDMMNGMLMLNVNPVILSMMVET